MLIVLYFSYFFISQNLNEFTKILTITLPLFSQLSFLFLLGLLLNGLLFKNILELFNINLKNIEWFGLTVVNRFSNYLFFKGGVVVRSLYLKKKYNFSFKNFFLVFLFISFIQVISISILALIFCLIYYIESGTYNLLLLTFLLVSIISATILFIFHKKITSKFKIKLPFDFVEKLKNKPTLLLSFIILSSGATILQSIRIYLIYNTLFETINFAPTVIISAIGTLSFYASITPAAIGIKEFFMSYTAELTGANFTITTAVASLDRIISIIWVFSLGIIFSIYFSKKNYAKDN